MTLVAKTALQNRPLIATLGVAQLLTFLSLCIPSGHIAGFWVTALLPALDTSLHFSRVRFLYFNNSLCILQSLMPNTILPFSMGSLYLLQ